MRTIRLTFNRLLALSSVLFLLSSLNAMALIHTWRGDANGQWGDDRNWANGAPLPGSLLLFPPNADNKTNFNNILNLETGAIQITGHAYHLGGSACHVTGGLASTNATTNEIALNLRTDARVYLGHTRGRLLFSGALTLRTFSTTAATREIYSAGYVELRGPVDARYPMVSPSGSTVWYSGTATLNIRGPGAVEMTGTADNAHGPTTVQDGTLYVNKFSGLAIPSTLSILDHGHVIVVRPNQIDDTSEVDLSSLGRLTVQGDETINRLKGIGEVTLDGGDLTVGGVNSSFEFGGRIGGTGGLTKVGVGTFTLDGTHNYSGPTTLRAGTLLVNGSVLNSPVNLLLGNLGGDGRMNSVSVASGALAPGFGGTSSKLRMNSLVIGSSGLLRWLQDANGTSGVIVDTSVTLNNPTLEIVAHAWFAPTNGQILTLIDNRGTQAVRGAFANVPTNGNLLVTDNQQRTYRVRYNGGDGNDLTLTFTNASLQLARTQPWQLSGGNGDETLDAGECVHLVCFIANTSTNSIRGVVADLRCDAEGVYVIQPHTRFDDLPPSREGMSRIAFQISTATNLPCGTNIPFRLSVRTTSHGAITIPFTVPTGGRPGTGPCEGCIAAIHGNIPVLQRDSTHQGVLIPSGDGDACASPNACPTFIDSPGIIRRYRVHSFTNATPPLLDNCFTLYLTSLSDERLMATVYRDRFDPDALCTTNFIVCTPRLAERSTQQCRFRWNSGVIRVVVTEFDGTANNAPYELRIAGSICRPELDIDRLPNEQVRLSWPTTSPGFVLGHSPMVDGVPELLGWPQHVWNGRFVTTNRTTSAPQEFYRLVLP